MAKTSKSKKESKSKEYESLAQTIKIQATSRISTKIRETYYTFEYSEERAIPNTPDINLDKERELLWEDCHKQVDEQVREAISLN